MIKIGSIVKLLGPGQFAGAVGIVLRPYGKPTGKYDWVVEVKNVDVVFFEKELQELNQDIKMFL